MCAINDGKAAPYFRLERGTRQGEPISGYLFTIVLEVIFALINANTNIGDLQFFTHNFLYSAYADDTTFFLRNEKSVFEHINAFDTFSLFSDLKISKEMCQVVCIGVLKGVKVALCGM